MVICKKTNVKDLILHFTLVIILISYYDTGVTNLVGMTDTLQALEYQMMENLFGQQSPL